MQGIGSFGSRNLRGILCNHFCRNGHFLLDGVSDRFVQPIAEQLTILRISTIIFTIQTFVYSI